MAKAKKNPASAAPLLAAVPLFSKCSKKDLSAIAKSGKIQTRKAGAEVVREGKAGAAFFLILNGSVDVVRGEINLARLHTGDFFGEMALLADQPRSATVTAVDDVELFVLSKFSFKSLLIGNPNISYGLLQIMAERVSVA